MFRGVGGKKCRPNKIKAVFSQASRNCYSLNYRECGLADILYSTGRAQILSGLTGVKTSYEVGLKSTQASVADAL
jgi:hypothetical protein